MDNVDSPSPPIPPLSALQNQLIAWNNIRSIYACKMAELQIRTVWAWSLGIYTWSNSHPRFIYLVQNLGHSGTDRSSAIAETGSFHFKHLKHTLSSIASGNNNFWWVSRRRSMVLPVWGCSCSKWILGWHYMEVGKCPNYAHTFNQFWDCAYAQRRSETAV